MSLIPTQREHWPSGKRVINRRADFFIFFCNDATGFDGTEPITAITDERCNYLHVMKTTNGVYCVALYDQVRGIVLEETAKLIAPQVFLNGRNIDAYETVEMQHGDVVSLYQNLYPFRLDSLSMSTSATCTSSPSSSTSTSSAPQAPRALQRQESAAVYAPNPSIFAHSHERACLQTKIDSCQERLKRARKTVAQEKASLQVVENRLLALDGRRLASCATSFAEEGCVVCYQERPCNPVSLFCCGKVVCASCFDQIRYRWLLEAEVDRSQISKFRPNHFICKPCPICRAPISQIRYNHKYHRPLLANVDYQNQDTIVIRID